MAFFLNNGEGGKPQPGGWMALHGQVGRGVHCSSLLNSGWPDIKRPFPDARLFIQRLCLAASAAHAARCTNRTAGINDPLNGCRCSGIGTRRRHGGQCSERFDYIRHDNLQLEKM